MIGLGSDKNKFKNIETRKAFSPLIQLFFGFAFEWYLIKQIYIREGNWLSIVNQQISYNIKHDLVIFARNHLI